MIRFRFETQHPELSTIHHKIGVGPGFFIDIASVDGGIRRTKLVGVSVGQRGHVGKMSDHGLRGLHVVMQASIADGHRAWGIAHHQNFTTTALDIERIGGRLVDAHPSPEPAFLVHEVQMFDRGRNSQHGALGREVIAGEVDVRLAGIQRGLDFFRIAGTRKILRTDPLTQVGIPHLQGKILDRQIHAQFRRAAVAAERRSGPPFRNVGGVRSGRTISLDACPISGHRDIAHKELLLAGIYQADGRVPGAATGKLGIQQDGVRPITPNGHRRNSIGAVQLAHTGGGTAQR